MFYLTKKYDIVFGKLADQGPHTVSHKNYLKNSNFLRGKLDCSYFFLIKIVRRKKHRIARHDLQCWVTNNQTNSQNFKTLKRINLQWLSRCHLRANRDKLALINRRWKCKKAKIDDYRKFTHEADWPTRQFPSRQLNYQKVEHVETCLLPPKDRGFWRKR